MKKPSLTKFIPNSLSARRRAARALCSLPEMTFRAPPDAKHFYFCAGFKHGMAYAAAKLKEEL